MSEVELLVLFSLCLIASAFFSGAEASLISIPAKRVKQLIEEGGKRAKLFEFLASKSNEILVTILIGNNFVNIFAASLATTLAQSYFKSEAMGYAVGATTLLILLFGEIVPKTFSRNHSEKLAYPILLILKLFYFLLYPAVRLTILFITIVLGKNAKFVEKIVTKDDIEFLVNEAEKEKSIDSKQIDLLTSILEFPTIKVKDIMTPRTQVHEVSKESSYDDIVKLVRDVEHSRYPVVDKDLDSTLGVLHVKDVGFLDPKDTKNFDVTKYLNPPFFVYEHMKIQAVFDHMNRKKVHLALVKDENGLVVGIVTLEDIMEEIFGEIQDEYDDEEDGIPEAEEDPLDGGLIVTAAINLRDLYNEYDVKIPLNDNYSTLAGFLLDMLGNNFPMEGNILFWEGYKFTLLKVVDHEMLEVKIESSDGEKHVIGNQEDKNQEETVSK